MHIPSFCWFNSCSKDRMQNGGLSKPCSPSRLWSTQFGNCLRSLKAHNESVMQATSAGPWPCVTVLGRTWCCFCVAVTRDFKIQYPKHPKRSEAIWEVLHLTVTILWWLVLMNGTILWDHVLKIHIHLPFTNSFGVHQGIPGALRLWPTSVAEGVCHQVLLCVLATVSQKAWHHRPNSTYYLRGAIKYYGQRYSQRFCRANRNVWTCRYQYVCIYLLFAHNCIIR